MRSNILPAALAGGVVIAAVIALLWLGNGRGPSGAGPMPVSDPPGAVQIFPSPAPRPVQHHRHRHLGASAAESQYAAAGATGTVLIAP